MITPRELFWGIVFPLILSALAILFDVRPWRRDRGIGRGGLGLAIGVCAGFAAAFIAIAGKPTFPPIEDQGWLVYLGIPVIVIAVMAKLVPPSVTAIVSALLLCVVPWLLLRHLAEMRDPQTFWLWMGGLCIAFVLWWAAMEALATRTRGGSLPLLITLVALVEAAALTNSYSQSFGQFAAAIAAAIVIVPLFVLWTGEVSLTRGGILAIGMLLLGLLVCGKFLAGLSVLDMALLALAPLAAWAGELPGLGGERSWKRLIVRSAAVLIVLSFVAVPAGKGLWKMIEQERTGGTPSESI